MPIQETRWTIFRQSHLFSYPYYWYIQYIIVNICDNTHSIIGTLQSGACKRELCIRFPSRHFHGKGYGNRSDFFVYAKFEEKLAGPPPETPNGTRQQNTKYKIPSNVWGCGRGTPGFCLHASSRHAVFKYSSTSSNLKQQQHLQSSKRSMRKRSRAPRSLAR